MDRSDGVGVFLFLIGETSRVNTQCQTGREANPRPYKHPLRKKFGELVEFGAGSGSCADYLDGLDSGG